VISYGLACLLLHRERLTAFFELVGAARGRREGSL